MTDPAKEQSQFVTTVTDVPAYTATTTAVEPPLAGVSQPGTNPVPGAEQLLAAEAAAAAEKKEVPTVETTAAPLDPSQQAKEEKKTEVAADTAAPAEQEQAAGNDATPSKFIRNQKFLSALNSAWGVGDITPNLQEHLQDIELKEDSRRGKKLFMTLDNGHKIGWHQSIDDRGTEFIGMIGRKNDFDSTDAKGVVAAAINRGWSAIDVHGEVAHKELMWLEAQRNGLKVANFEPPVGSAVLQQWEKEKDQMLDMNSTGVKQPEDLPEARDLSETIPAEDAPAAPAEPVAAENSWLEAKLKDPKTPTEEAQGLQIARDNMDAVEFETLIESYKAHEGNGPGEGYKAAATAYSLMKPDAAPLPEAPKAEAPKAETPKADVAPSPIKNSFTDEMKKIIKNEKDPEAKQKLTEIRDAVVSGDKKIGFNDGFIVLQSIKSGKIDQAVGEFQAKAIPSIHAPKPAAKATSPQP